MLKQLLKKRNKTSHNETPQCSHRYNHCQDSIRNWSAPSSNRLHHTRTLPRCFVHRKLRLRSIGDLGNLTAYFCAFHVTSCSKGLHVTWYQFYFTGTGVCSSLMTNAGGTKTLLTMSVHSSATVTTIKRAILIIVHAMTNIVADSFMVALSA